MIKLAKATYYILKNYLSVFKKALLSLTVVGVVSMIVYQMLNAGSFEELYAEFILLLMVPVLLAVIAYMVQIDVEREESNRLTIEQAWDEIDKQKGKLIGFKGTQFDNRYEYWMDIDNLYTYKTNITHYNKPYRAPYDAINICDCGFIISGGLATIKLVPERQINNRDIIELIKENALSVYSIFGNEFTSMSKYTSMDVITNILSMYSNVIPQVKKEFPDETNELKKFIGDDRNASDFSYAAFKRLFEKDVWPIWNPSDFNNIDIAKARYIWYRDRGNKEAALKYAREYNDLKAIEEDIG